MQRQKNPEIFAEAQNVTYGTREKIQRKDKKKGALNLSSPFPSKKKVLKRGLARGAELARGLWLRNCDRDRTIPPVFGRTESNLQECLAHPRRGGVPRK